MTTATSPLLNTTPRQRGFIIVTVMLVAFLEVLDSTIVNVALTHMMPALGANQDQITWVLTSYVVTSAIVLPLTGFLSQRLGEKRLLLICTVGFMAGSFLCGTATSLSFMIASRCLQGCFGASLIPLSQSILKQTFSLEKQGKAMGIWAMGFLVAPVMGPTLGGLITQSASWRWIFYINTPICAMAFLLALKIIPSIAGEKRKIDWIEIGFMAVAIACLQIFLDQGNSLDWFASNFIVSLFLIFVVCAILFLFRSFASATPAVNLRTLSNRNFSMSCLTLMIFCGSQFSLLALEPIMLQTLFGYTALNAGLTTIPMGLVSAVTVAIASSLINRINVKWILIVGCLFCMAGAHYLSSLNTQTDQWHFIMANGLLGCGMGCIMMPLSITALSTLEEQHITTAAGLFGSSRMLGTSIGLSLMITLVSRQTQVSWNSFGGKINRFSIPLRQWLWQQHGSLHNPVSVHQLQQTLYHQAAMQAFLDAITITSLGFACMIPVILLMQPIKLDEGKPMAH